MESEIDAESSVFQNVFLTTKSAAVIESPFAPSISRILALKAIGSSTEAESEMVKKTRFEMESSIDAESNTV